MNGRVAYVRSGTGGRVGTAYDRMVKELFNGNYAAARKAKLRIKSKKLASEFEARGMEQKLMDYFGGAKGGQLANKNVSFRWGRMDSRAKKFRAAYRDEDLFSKTMKGLDLW